MIKPRTGLRVEFTDTADINADEELKATITEVYQDGQFRVVFDDKVIAVCGPVNRDQFKEIGDPS